MRFRSPYQWLFLLLFIVSGLCAGALMGNQNLFALARLNTIPDETRTSFQLIAEAWKTIHEKYVNQRAVQPETLTQGAIRGMVDALGDRGHSRFLTAKMVQMERNFFKGVLEGIGAEVRMKNNQAVIVAPMDGSPAQRAGLKPGDVFLKVDGEEVTDLPLDEVVGKIIGPAGSTVRLTILRPESGQNIEVTIVRTRIALHEVRWQRLPGAKAAHVRLATFTKGVSEDLRKELIAIKEKNLAGIILDLRNNPGGLFDEAVSSASLFLDGGNVLWEKDAQGKITPVPVESGGLMVSLPMVVLINGGTASAAEIVAGALQDSGRAKLVGEKTFGTGTVLEMFPLQDGSALLLAVREWLTPAGRLIWHRGIAPDVPVSLPPEVTPLFPEVEGTMTEEQLRTSGDRQLLRALDLFLALKKS